MLQSETIMNVLMNIITKYENKGLEYSNTFTTIPRKGNNDTTYIVFAEMVLVLNKLRTFDNSDTHWYNDEWREVVLDLKELSNYVSALNDSHIKDWGGNLESIVEEFVKAYNEEVNK